MSTIIPVPSEHKKAFKLLKRLKSEGADYENLFSEISTRFALDRTLLEKWNSELEFRFHRRVKIVHCQDLLYFIGAFLGDGWVYSWKPGQYQVGVVGEKEFAEKCAERLTCCTGKTVTAHEYSHRNIWQTRLHNAPLYFFLENMRENLTLLDDLLKNGSYRENSMQFIEGFFDAEGCVKIIKEPCRKTPKICLDICNTNREYLEIIRILLQEHLGIVARFSIQNYSTKYDGHVRKTAYHLRIYKKEYVRIFPENLHTLKVKKEKRAHVEKWLKSKNRNPKYWPVTLLS